MTNIRLNIEKQQIDIDFVYDNDGLKAYSSGTIYQTKEEAKEAFVKHISNE